MHLFFLVLFCLFLTACDDTPNYAPVVEISNIEPIPKTGTHHAMQGETLYEIAWRYGLDYRLVAGHNQIRAPYTLQVGQAIYLRHRAKPQDQIKAEHKFENPTFENENVSVEPTADISTWSWPAKGKIVNSFSRLNKGINISGHAGDAIYAAASGKVVYCGDGLRGYGNLIILKHNSVYLSAYAHNQAMFVKEGDWVKQGQKIAEMGNTGSDTIMLHFEIRRAGKPIDPISVLKI